MLDPHLCAGRILLLGEWREDVVIVDDAVLEDFHEPGALMCIRRFQHGWQVLLHVDRARDEAPARAQRERAWVGGRSTEPNGVEGVRVPTREVGEYCPLVRP